MLANRNNSTSNGVKKVVKKSPQLARQKKLRVKKYPAHYLGIILVGLLLIEGVIFGMATEANWQNGYAVLDVHAGVDETSHDVVTVFQPMIDAVDNLNKFYQMTTTEMSKLLDLSSDPPGTEVMLIFNGVAEFYGQASIQMTRVLDTSDFVPWQSQIAGASIEN